MTFYEAIDEQDIFIIERLIGDLIHPDHKRRMVDDGFLRAVSNNDWKLTRYFLECGAYDRVAITLAKEKGHIELANYLTAEFKDTFVIKRWRPYEIGYDVLIGKIA